MGQTVDKYLPQLKTNKLKTLKQKLTTISSSNVVEETSSDVTGAKIKQPTIIPELADNKEYIYSSS